MIFERINALLALGLGLLAWGLSFGLPRAEGPGPELFPRILGTALILGGLGLLLTPASTHPGPLPGWPRAVILLALTLASPLLLTHIGLALTAALLAGVGTLLAQEGVRRALWAALVLYLFVVWVFGRLLGVPL